MLRARARTRGFTSINIYVDCSARAHAWLCFYGGDKDNRSHVCVCCDEGCPAMNEGKRRWAAAEEGQGWRRQQRARASLGSSCAPQEGSNLRMVAIDGHSQSCCPPAAGEAVASSTHIRAQTHTRVLLTCTGYTCACTRHVLLTCTHVRSETPRFSKIQNIGQARRQFSHRLGGGRPTNKQINASAF